MSTTASQKLGALILPVGAFLLAWATSTPEWNPVHVQGSWREVMHPELARGGPPKEPAAAAPAEPEKEGEKETAKAPGKPAVKKGPKPPAESPGEAPQDPPAQVPSAPPEKPAPAPPPEKPKEPAGLDFKVSGLAPAATSVPLTVPAGQRLDIHVLASGAVRLGPTVADPDMALTEIRVAAREKKENGMLFLVPQARSNWDDVLALASAGAAAAWTRIGLCASSPEDAAQGRVLLLDIPASEAPTKKALDLLTVKVKPGQPMNPSFTLNGEEVASAGALRAKATSLHSEYEEGFEEGYSTDIEETPWIVDGAGASSGGVIAALDAIRDGGAKCVRLAGLRKPVTEDGK